MYYFENCVRIATERGGKMFLPKNAEKIIDLLTENGYKAYAVGGC